MGVTFDVQSDRYVDPSVSGNTFTVADDSSGNAPSTYTNEGKISKPWAFLNGQQVAEQKTTEINDRTYSNNTSILYSNTPATITFVPPAGGVVRYELNGKPPTLGSPVYNGPIKLWYNGGGFSSKSTVIKYKTFYQGKTSDVGKIEFKLV